MSPPNTTKEYAIRKKIKSREKKRKKTKTKKNSHANNEFE